MGELLKDVFKEYIAGFEGIQVLARIGVFDEEEKAIHEHNLLFNIIDTMRSEVFFEEDNAHKNADHAR